MSKMSELIEGLRFSSQRGQAALEMLPYLSESSLKGTFTILSKIPVRDRLHQHKRLGKVVHNHLKESCQYLARNHTPPSHPSTAIFKCWHWPQWEQYGDLISLELHFHAPRDQVTPALGGGRTYVNLSFICLLTADCVSLLAPALSKLTIWTELTTGSYACCCGFYAQLLICSWLYWRRVMNIYD